MKTYVIDGKNFSDIEGFYCEIDRLMTNGIDFRTGHNLYAFRDILRGGFGCHEYGEPIVIKWFSYEKSKRELGDTMILAILESIADHDDSGCDCKLELY